MKQQVLDFISGLQTLFSGRRSKMPRFGAHKPHLAAIETSETELAAAKDIVEKLDDSNRKTFAESLLYFYIEKVVPVLIKWNNRLKTIAENTPNANISGHIKARDDFKVQRVVAYQLLTQINAMNDELILPIPAGDDAEVQGKAILKSYNREGYLATHVVDMPNDKAANDEVAAGSSPTMK